MARRLAAGHIALVGAMSAATLFAIWQAVVERRQALAFTAMSQGRVVPGSGWMATAREDVYRAQALARRAAMLEGQSRGATLDEADRLVSAGLAKRPRWGEAWVVKSYIATLRDGPAAPSSLKALAHSYAETPFLRDAADWRISYVASQWPLIDAATRTAAAREAIVLTRISRVSAAHVRVLIAGTPLYQAVEKRDMSASSGVR